MAYTKGRLLTLKNNERTFMAGAKHNIKYEVDDTISFDRWNEYLKMQVELAYDISFEGLWQGLNAAYDKLNKQKFADASCEIRDLMKGVHDIGERKVPTIIRMCALFINKEGEDRRTITDTMIAEKHRDWADAGYDMGSFFLLALHSIPNLIETYKNDIQNISTK